MLPYKNKPLNHEIYLFEESEQVVFASAASVTNRDIETVPLNSSHTIYQFLFKSFQITDLTNLCKQFHCNGNLKLKISLFKDNRVFSVGSEICPASKLVEIICKKASVDLELLSNLFIFISYGFKENT